MSATLKQRISGATVALAVLLSGTLLGSCNKGSSEVSGTKDGSGDIATVSADVTEATDRVTRITYLNGDASVRAVGADDWDVVDLNQPVLEGDELYVPEGGQFELGLGASHYARFDENTYVTATRLDPKWTQLEVGEGTVTLALADFSDEHFEINSPGAAVIPQEGGSYRVDVLADGTTRVRVLRGRAEIVTQEGSAIAEPGDTIDLGLNTQGLANAYTDYPDDDWDRWSGERDVYYNNLYTHDVPQPVRTLYGREDIFGVTELIAFGIWQALDDDDDYYVWQPSAALHSGWSPYQDGYWDYVPAVGYTWVSNEAWGWAPYHYGRWDYRDNFGWYWAPHRDTITTVASWREPYAWRPSLAYVWQPDGFNTIAWVPLAPGEPYIPYSATYFGAAPVVSVDFRPRHLLSHRDVVFVDANRFGDPVVARIARSDEALKWAKGDFNRVRVAKLDKRDRQLAKANAVRPRDDIRRRSVVVDPESIDGVERAEKRAQKMNRDNARGERQVVKAERRAVKVDRKPAPREQAQVKERDAKFQKRNRTVAHEGRGITPNKQAFPAYRPADRVKGGGRANRPEKVAAPDRSVQRPEPKARPERHSSMTAPRRRASSASPAYRPARAPKVHAQPRQQRQTVTAGQTRTVKPQKAAGVQRQQKAAPVQKRAKHN